MFIASSLQLALALLLFSTCFVISQTTTTPSTSNNNNNSIQKPKPADYTHASEILKTVESGSVSFTSSFLPFSPHPSPQDFYISCQVFLSFFFSFANFFFSLSLSVLGSDWMPVTWIYQVRSLTQWLMESERWRLLLNLVDPSSNSSQSKIKRSLTTHSTGLARILLTRFGIQSLLSSVDGDHTGQEIRSSQNWSHRKLCRKTDHFFQSCFSIFLIDLSFLWCIHNYCTTFIIIEIITRT